MRMLMMMMMIAQMGMLLSACGKRGALSLPLMPPVLENVTFAQDAL